MTTATALRMGLGVLPTALTLTACGPDGPVTTAKQIAQPRPNYPAWAEPMIGRPMAQFTHGHGECKGAFDVVAANYNVKPVGSTVQGWGWDVAAKQPVQRLLFVDMDDHIVGAGNGAVNARPDVTAARPEVTSKMTGWSGVVGEIKGGRTNRPQRRLRPRLDQSRRRDLLTLAGG